jgi:hypothetical protein
MKRLLAAVFLALAMPALAAPALAVRPSDLAPADRYFGRMKMSILGIRNSLKDLSADADARPDQARHILDKVLFVDDALRDWQRHFPRDPWIPKYTYALAELYGKLQVDEARLRRTRTLAWLVATYPKSEYARHARLARS